MGSGDGIHGVRKKMNDGDGALRQDGIGGGYCFSAAPPPPVSRSRVPKGRKQLKSGIGMLGKGVNNSFVGSGGSGQRWGTELGFRTVVGNVEDTKYKAKVRGVDLDSAEVGASCLRVAMITFLLKVLRLLQPPKTM